MGISISNTTRRFIDWQHKKRDSARMRYIARNILRMPDSPAVWHKIRYRKASDPQSAFTVMWTSNGEREHNLIVHDGTRSHNLAHDNLMGMDRDEFKPLLALLEQQKALGHKYHVITEQPKLPRYADLTFDGDGIDIDTVIAVDLRS